MKSTGIFIVKISCSLLLTLGLVLWLGADPCAAQSSGDATFLHEEAGIAAYAKMLATPLDFSNIAQQLDSYTVGSDYLQGTFSELYDALLVHDVHVYIHEDGWMIAYLPPEAITSEIFMTSTEGQSCGNTTLECALNLISIAAGAENVIQVDYFNFRYANADWLLKTPTYGPLQFGVQFPGYDVLEQSWALHHRGTEGEAVTLLWDTAPISTRFTPGWNYDLLSDPGADDGIMHTANITAETSVWRSSGVFAFTYDNDNSRLPFVLEGVTYYEQIPMRYPRELIRDTSPPIITSAVTDTMTLTNGIVATIDVEFNEWAWYWIYMYTYYADGTSDRMSVSSTDFVKTGWGGTYCLDCSRIAFWVFARDMSGNDGWIGYYTTEHHLPTYKVYLPLIHRH